LGRAFFGAVFSCFSVRFGKVFAVVFAGGLVGGWRRVFLSFGYDVGFWVVLLVFSLVFSVLRRF
jgi:hypothetical protein